MRAWLEGLSDCDFGRVDFLVGLLAENAETLGEPPYWLAPQRRIVHLTVFAKTRGAETAEVNVP